MNGDDLILIELLLVFGVTFGWGLNELRQLKKYKRNKAALSDEKHDANRQADRRIN